MSSQDAALCYNPGMRVRPSAKLLVLDSNERVLLFRFVHSSGALAGQDFWAPPGGGVEDGETFEQAAIRELGEETGMRADDVGAEVARREVIVQLPDGEYVISDERYFLIRTDGALTCLRMDGLRWKHRSCQSGGGGPRTNSHKPRPLSGPRACWRCWMLLPRCFHNQSTIRAGIFVIHSQVEQRYS
jgi:8-oxo-dGTP pyrophosphatase MutT (NUDIX family)